MKIIAFYAWSRFMHAEYVCCADLWEIFVSYCIFSFQCQVGQRCQRVWQYKHVIVARNEQQTPSDIHIVMLKSWILCFFIIILWYVVLWILPKFPDLHKCTYSEYGMNLCEFNNEKCHFVVFITFTLFCCQIIIALIFLCFYYAHNGFECIKILVFAQCSHHINVLE